MSGANQAPIEVLVELAVPFDGGVELWSKGRQFLLRGLKQDHVQTLVQVLQPGAVLMPTQLPRGLAALLRQQGLARAVGADLERPPSLSWGERVRAMRENLLAALLGVSQVRLRCQLLSVSQATPWVRRLAWLDAAIPAGVVIGLCLLSIWAGALDLLDLRAHYRAIRGLEKLHVIGWLLAAVLFHELGHAVSAYRFTQQGCSLLLKLKGFVMPVAAVRLVGISHLRAVQRLRVSLAGVRFQWAFASLLFLIAPVGSAAHVAGQIGLLMTALNLLPLPGSDGWHAWHEWQEWRGLPRERASNEGVPSASDGDRA